MQIFCMYFFSPAIASCCPFSCDDEIIEPTPLGLEKESPLASAIIDAFPLMYDVTNRDSTGSDLITSVVKEMCEVEFISDLEYKDCRRYIGTI